MTAAAMTDLYQDDKSLARRMLAGDESAFDAFFETYFPGLYRFALARLDGNADAAEDVAQATLCRAIRKMKTYRGEAALFTWLCTFCRHELSAHYTRHQRIMKETPLTEENPEIRAALESLAADAVTPHEHLERRELARLVQVTLDSLPPKYGDALEWKVRPGAVGRRYCRAAQRRHEGGRIAADACETGVSRWVRHCVRRR